MVMKQCVNYQVGMSCGVAAMEHVNVRATACDQEALAKAETRAMLDFCAKWLGEPDTRVIYEADV